MLLGKNRTFFTVCFCFYHMFIRMSQSLILPSPGVKQIQLWNVGTSSNYVAYTNKPFFSNLTKSNNRFMNIGAHDNSIYYYLLYNCYQNVLRYNPLPDRVLYGNSKDYHLGVNNTTSVPAMPLIILCLFSPCLYSISRSVIYGSLYVRLLYPLLTASLSEILPAIKSVTDLSIKTTKAEIHELIERCHTKRKPILITLAGIR